MTQRWLIASGGLLLLLGALILGRGVFGGLSQAGDRAVDVSAPTEALVTHADRGPSLVWSVAGGLSLALGAGLIGIGMNRWRRQPQSHDAVRT